MKAWRKHNSTAFVRKHPGSKIKKSERNWFFQAENTAHVSKLLVNMFARIGIKVATVE